MWSILGSTKMTYTVRHIDLKLQRGIRCMSHVLLLCWKNSLRWKCELSWHEMVIKTIWMPVTACSQLTLAGFGYGSVCPKPFWSNQNTFLSKQLRFPEWFKQKQTVSALKWRLETKNNEWESQPTIGPVTRISPWLMAAATSHADAWKLVCIWTHVFMCFSLYQLAEANH